MNIESNPMDPRLPNHEKLAAPAEAADHRMRTVTGCCSNPPRAEPRQPERCEEGERVKPQSQKDISQMLKEFRRQDRANMTTFATAFAAILVVLAVWAWHYTQ